MASDFDPKAYVADDSGEASGDFDPKAYVSDESPSLLSQAGQAVLGGAAKAGKTLDTYGGAPVRAAIGAAQDGKNPLTAYTDQFGGDPDQAPTGKDIAAKAGLSTDSLLSAGAQKKLAQAMKYTALGYLADKVAPGSVENLAGASPAGIAGAAVNVGTDPLTYVPVGELAEGAGKLTKGALGSSAEHLAVKATGATGKQAAEFAPGIGRELLDRGIVKFGSDPAAIAGKTQNVMDAAEASKQAMINGPLANATVDRNAIYNGIQGEIAKLSGNESKLGVIRQLDSKLQDITGVAHQNGAVVPLGQSEEIRRGFDKAAKWNSSSDADVLEANKITANVYRQAGEDAATAVDPALGAQFKADKTTSHRLIPVQEAAEKRALQLQQSPHGGLLDLVAMGGGGEVGAMLGGPVGAAIGSGVGYAGKALRPRYASMGAVTADAIAKAAPTAAMAAAPAIAAARGTNFAQMANAPVSGRENTPEPRLTGEAAWAQSGLKNLGISDQTQAQNLLSDPKARRLLIQASDLKPGSKAMKAIQNQIQSQWGNQ